MLAVKELIRRFENLNKLRGKLTLVPVVNEAAFHRGHRCAEDGKDLARTCPGDPDGSITERTAHSLSSLIEAADYYIDLHTGGTELAVLPLAGYVLHPDKNILDTQRRMARAFRLPFVWGTSAELQGRSLSVARDAAIPAIYVEYLGAHREAIEIASHALSREEPEHPIVTGCLNVMRSIGLFDGASIPEIPQIVVEDSRPQSGHMQICHPAPITGFLKPLVDLGEFVEKDRPIAEITPIDEGTPVFVLAAESGTVVVLRDYPRINEGDSTAVIASNAHQV